MKKLFFSFLALCLCFSTFAQGQAETYINEALTAVKSKNYKQAQLSLQDAINEINNIMAQEVLAQLPEDLNGLKAQKSDDQTNTAGMGMLGGGSTIGRKYQSADGKQKIDLNIISNSPLIGSMSMMMNNPMFMQSNNNQKSVRVGTRRAILKNDKSTEYDDNGTSKEVTNYELSVILGQTLITIKGEGFATEQAFTACYQKIDFEKLAKALGEN